MVEASILKDLLKRYREGKLAHAFLLETNDTNKCYKDVLQLLKELNCPQEYRDDCDFPCITKAEAMDWLEGKGWKFSIMFADNNLYEYIVYFANEYISVHEHISGYRETMLEAQDAAIITALEKL